MGKQYHKKKQTGDEYVIAAKKFHQYTVHAIQKMPAEFKNYILDPLFEASFKIEQYVSLANAVYVSKNKENMANEIQARTAYLSEALRWFDVYDTAFENLMGIIDLQVAEKLRLKNILEQIIQEKGLQLEGRPENIPNVLTVDVRNHVSDIEYAAMSGNTKSLKTALTAKNKDHWLLLEAKARDLISKRLSKDRAQIAALTKAA